MKLILVDPDERMYDAWRETFMPDPRVEIYQGRFEQVAEQADALVTAGNSFGLMDGGVDLAVARAFEGIEAVVQHEIRTTWRGELNVGAALVLSLGVTNPQWLVYAPTMRVPMSIAGTDAVYRAIWAALTAAHRHNLSVGTMSRVMRINTVMVPGLGTGAGKMPHDEAARQMALAWRSFGTQSPACETSHKSRTAAWTAAVFRHHEIVGYGDGCCRAELARLTNSGGARPAEG